MKPHLALILLALAIALAAAPIFTGQYYGTGDTVDVFIPLETFFQSEQLAGRLPVWHPDVAWGFPVLASAQIGFFYPLLLLGRLFPIWLYMPALFLLHIVSAGIGTFALLRAQRVSVLGSLLGGCAFALSQFVWQHATHLNIILVLSWLPWQLLGAHLVAQQATIRTRHIGALAFLFGIPFLAGHIQIPILTAVVAALYLLHQRWVNRLPWKRFLLACIGAAVLTVGIAAAQLVPTAELVTLSNRGEAGQFDIEQANQHSFPLYHLQTAVFPRFFSTDGDYWGKRLEIEYGFFIGTIPLLLIFGAWRHRKSLRFWWLLTGLSFLLALGNLSPFRLVGLEPSLWLFTAPARWLLFTSLAGAVLAAHGFDALADNPKQLRRYVSVSLTIVVLFVATYNIALSSISETPASTHIDRIKDFAPQLLEGRDQSYYVDKIDQLVTSLSSSGLSTSFSFTWLPITILLLAVIAYKHPRVIMTLAAIELILIAATTSPTVSWQTLLSPPSAVDSLPHDVSSKQARTLTLSPAGEDTGFLLTNPDTRSSATIRTRQDLLGPLVHAQFGIPGIEWPASIGLRGHAERLTDLRASTGTTLHEQAAALNIGAVLAPHEVTLPPSDETLSLPVGNLQTLVAAPRAEFVTSNDSMPVTYSEINPTYVQLGIQTEEPGYLIIRDSWYPGWKLSVTDTKTDSAPLATSDDIFRTAPLPAGSYTVHMHYKPWTTPAGVALSLIAGVISLLLIVRKSRSQLRTARN